MAFDAPNRILHLAPSVSKHAFGVGPVALNLAFHQRSLGALAEVWTMDSHLDVSSEYSFCLSGDLPVKMHTASRILNFQISPQLLSELRRADMAGLVLHQHGLWTGLSLAPRLLRKRRETPVVITPHGFLSQWALNKGRGKKKLFYRLLEEKNLQSAACLHAVCRGEIADFRALGLRSPIAYIPNGIPSSWLRSSGNGEAFKKQFGINTTQKVIFFLSRITPKKGLLPFLKALAANIQHAKGWTFVIAGVDEFNHEVELRTFVQNNTLQETVRFVGPLFGEDKLNGFSAADICVLTSYSEGLPIFLLESMGQGRPVLISDGVPVPEISESEAGWQCSTNPNDIGAALREIFSAPNEELQRRGENARRLVSSLFTWDAAASKCLELYSWVLRQGPEPSFLY